MAKIIYILSLAILISPVWLLEYFHTGDGPAHLACANVLKSLVSGSGSFYQNFFILHLQTVPNTVVQVLLALLMTYTSWFYATKILITSIMLIFMFGYRSMVLSLSGSRKTFPVLIMLMVYAYPLRMGLYSFLLGLGIMMFVFAYYIRHVRPGKLRSIFVFSFLLITTWFCHFFALCALILFIFIYESVKFLFLVLKKQDAIFYLRELPYKLFAILPVVCLSIFFYKEAEEGMHSKFIEMKTLVSWFFDMNVMYNFGTDKEFIIRKIFFILMIFGFGNLIINWKRFSAVTISFLILISVLLTLFYFLMPANYFSGGSINLRFAYLLLIILCIFIDLMLISNIQLILKMSLVGIGVYFAASNEVEMLHPYSNDIIELITATNHLKGNSVILPLNYNNDNLQYNMLLYMGCNKEIIVLDNAEASTPNSLISWRKNLWHPEWIGNYLTSNTPKIHPQEYEDKVNKKIDYIVRWCWKDSMNDSATLQTNAIIDKLYKPVHRSLSGKTIVYGRK